jgi:dipeptidyl aminopeptidase/acylaminoacyl peptidase
MRFASTKKGLVSLALAAALVASASAQGARAGAAPAATPATAAPAAGAPAGGAAGAGAGGNDANDTLAKKLDDLMWFQKMGDIAEIDKDEYTGMPSAHRTRPHAPGAGNPLKLHLYEFIPKNLDRKKPQPLIVFVHQGVHASLDTTIDAHLIRELIQQGYTVVATDYRGSTGYGRGFYEEFDYGGREVDDVYVGMKFMLDRYKWLDPKRVGIVGWSHGGMITLLNIFAHPHEYAVAYAGVPVSDVIARLGYENDSYRTQFSAPYAIGETVNDDIAEYRKRSPVSHAKELDTPLLIHTNTNDEDVNVLEVEHLIQALTFEKKKFDYKIYENAPGGHYFNRMDTPFAIQSRKEVYDFLAKYLHPGT